MILATLSGAAFMASLDVFIVNVAFPDIGHDFNGASLANLSWILNGYTIVYAALLVPLGRLADRYGRKAGFVGGLALFTAASAACAFSTGLWMLVAFRVLQAVGAAALTPTSLGLLLTSTPPERRVRAVRIWAASGALAAAIGPVVGGVLVQASWRWVFLVNLPVGVVAVIAAVRSVPDSRDESITRTPDLLGAAMLAAAIGAVSLGLVRGSDWGWGSATTIATFAARRAGRRGLLAALAAPPAADHRAGAPAGPRLRVVERHVAVLLGGLRSGPARRDPVDRGRVALQRAAHRARDRARPGDGSDLRRAAPPVREPCPARARRGSRQRHLRASATSSCSRGSARSRST